jgi:hypothetical protein
MMSSRPALPREGSAVDIGCCVQRVICMVVGPVGGPRHSSNSNFFDSSALIASKDLSSSSMARPGSRRIILVGCLK